MTGAELTNILIGATLLALGCASALASLLPARRGSALLRWVGLSVGLYSTRLLALQEPVRVTIAETWFNWRYVPAFISYLINIPLTYMVAGSIGPGWRNSTHWASRAAIAFAIAAMIIDVAIAPGTGNALNRWLVLLLIFIGLANIFHASRSGRPPTVFTERIVVIGALIFALFIVNENTGQPVVTGTNIEAIGMLVFVGCLGYAVVHSIFRAETEFAAVQRELGTARQIQQSLLPREIPACAGLDIAVRFVPVTAVAGDIYDFVQLGPSVLGILVADVSGHGIPAALVASMVKVAFSAQVDHADDPARVLTAMNQILCRHLEHAYVTAVYAVVNMERQTVTIANAGHPAPLLHGRGGTSLLETARGLMLGLFPAAEYTSTEITDFAPGDRLLLYSDGILEARNRAGEFFDGDRVAHWLSRIEHQSAEELAEGALSELTRWTGGGFEDDVTFVIAERGR